MHTTRVSIPYRQTINKKYKKKQMIQKIVSIPYRQTINLSLKHHRLRLKWSFNSLQVDYKPILSLLTTPVYLGFNSLQVDYKLGIVHKSIYHFIVSIPYRQTINSMKTAPPIFSSICFNSLQVDYKHLNELGRIQANQVSIPYRQTINKKEEYGISI